MGTIHRSSGVHRRHGAGILVPIPSRENHQGRSKKHRKRHRFFSLTMLARFTFRPQWEIFATPLVKGGKIRCLSNLPPLHVVSRSIRFMRLFTGISRRRRVKRQSGNQKRRYSLHCRRHVFETLRNDANIITLVLLSPFTFSLTAKCVTLNGHFTLNFHYEQRFQKSVYILSLEPIFRIFLLYHVTSRDMRKRVVIRRIFGIRGRTVDLS